MILALGVKPLKAAITVLLANTAPVAFGAVAVPIVTAGDVGGKDPHIIATIVGHQAPFLAMFVPVILLFILDGMKGVKDGWLPAFRYRYFLRYCAVDYRRNSCLQPHRRGGMYRFDGCCGALPALLETARC